MKRLIPFLLIVAVALGAVAAGVMMYREKMRVPTPKQAAAAAPSSSPAAGGTAAEQFPALHARGPADAPVTLEIFGDFQCPPCALATRAISQLEHDYKGRLRVVFREFPLEMHSHALEAALAAEAAGIQGRFWEMHDLLYKYQDVWSKVSDVSHFFESYAQSLGLNVMRFTADCQSDSLRARVLAEGQIGVARGVENTPSIFINGTRFRGAFNRENLQRAIENALAGKKDA